MPDDHDSYHNYVVRLEQSALDLRRDFRELSQSHARLLRTARELRELVAPEAAAYATLARASDTIAEAQRVSKRLYANGTGTADDAID